MAQRLPGSRGASGGKAGGRPRHPAMDRRADPRNGASGAGRRAPRQVRALHRGPDPVLAGGEAGWPSSSATSEATCNTSASTARWSARLRALRSRCFTQLLQMRPGEQTGPREGPAIAPGLNRNGAAPALLPCCASAASSPRSWGECADLALHCAEPSRLDQPRQAGGRAAPSSGSTCTACASSGALFPFSAPSFYRGLPLLALSSCTPLLRKGFERRLPAGVPGVAREDGEGAALLGFRGLARGGPVYRALAEVARRARAARARRPRGRTARARCSCADRGVERAQRPRRYRLLRWAKRGAASLVHGTLDL